MIDLNGWSLFIFWALFAVAGSLFGYRLWFLYARLCKGKDDGRQYSISKHFKQTVIDIVIQRCSLKFVTKNDKAGIGHAAIFWGFALFSVGYLVNIFAAVGFGLEGYLAPRWWYHVLIFLIDIAGFFVIVALVLALIRRYYIKPVRLERNLEAGLILAAILILMLCHYLYEGIRILVDPESATMPFALLGSKLVSLILRTSDSLILAGHGIWWLHYIVLLGLLVGIPFSKHLHVLAAPINLLLRDDRPTGKLTDIELTETDRWGANRVTDLSRKLLLDTYACTQCGRCNINCPAFLTEKPLAPRKVLADIKDHLISDSDNIDLISNAGGKPAPGNGSDLIIEGLYSCTTCGACIEICPVGNRPLDSIIELRRGLVYKSTFDPGHMKALKTTSETGNPNGIARQDQDTLLEQLGLEKATARTKTDLLYWLGCSTYFDDRTRDIVKAVVRLVKNAGLTIAALGSEEACCGDFVRRTGDEGLFQRLASQNIRTLQKYNFDRILTHCPHGYNTLKNEYGSYGLKADIVHHSQIIGELIKKGTVHVKKREMLLSYHDPCYLGRHNQEYETVREIINEVAKLEELPMNRSQSLCCGAGGGHMFRHLESGSRIQDMRLSQIDNATAETVVCACPYCLLMLEDAALLIDSEQKLKFKDIAEIVDESLSKI